MIAPIKLHLLMFMHINQIGISAYTIKIPAVIKHCCLWADMKNYASSSFESIEQCFSWLFFLWKLFNYQQLSTINNWLFFFITSIYKFSLSVCLFVSNERPNGRTDRAQILRGTSRDPREGFWMVKYLKIWV